MTTIGPFGEAAFLVEVDGPEAGQALHLALSASPIPGVTGIVPARRSVLVEFDPLLADGQSIAGALRSLAGAAAPPVTARRRRTIPVVYGGSHGPDLPEVAALVGMTEGQVIEMHVAAEHRALFGGFAPGFAYLGGLPPALDVRRLATPRTRTPAGSVGVADGMTGIYPADLPGGWRVIGRTPVMLFDPRRDPPAYLVAGDVVAFRPVAATEWDRHVGAPSDW